ncbi:MAG: hypothetical protein WC627_08935 [Legionella sp.]|jgi:hypothetical protein
MLFFDSVAKEDVPLNAELDCSAFERLSPDDAWYLKANYRQQNETDNSNPYSSY